MKIKKIDGKVMVEISLHEMVLIQFSVLEYMHLLKQSYRNPMDRTPITEGAQRNIEELGDMHEEMSDFLKKV